MKVELLRTDWNMNQLIIKVLARMRVLDPALRYPSIMFIDLVISHNLRCVDLELLLASADANFWEDVVFIAQNLDRRTGTLGACPHSCPRGAP
jgi:hypothetical protein